MLHQEDSVTDPPITKSPQLLDDHEDGGDDGERIRSSWVQKVINLEESKAQIIYALPVIFTNLFIYCIPLTSVMFASHLGQLELAGATLANSWATVTGVTFMVPFLPMLQAFHTESNKIIIVLL